MVFAHSIALLGLLRPLEQYMEQHREAGLTIYEVTTADFRAMLDMHQADVAVAIVEEGQMHTNGYLCRPLEPCVWKLAVPSRSPLAGRSRIHLSEAREERFIMPYTHQKEYILRCQRAGFYPSIAHYTSSLHSTLALVSEGFGATLLQTRIHEDPYSERVCYIELDDFPRDMLALFFRQEDTSPLVKGFVEFYCGYFGQSGNPTPENAVRQ